MNMNKTLVTVLVAIAVLVVGAIGAYLFLTSRAGTDEVLPKTTESGHKTLRDLMMFANNQKCTFKDMETSSEGVVYSGNGQVRADYTGVSDGKSTSSHVISDGTTVYMWFDGAESGFKTSFEPVAMDKGVFDGQTGSPSGDLNKSVDFECKPWSIDSAMFDLPNIEFVDYSVMTPDDTMTIDEEKMTGDGVGVDDQDQECSACNSLPAEAQAQCRQALGC